MLAARKVQVKSELLLNRLQDARLESDKLFGIVRPGSLYERPIPERHRIIFYIGHLEAFDWNLLANRLGAAKPPQPEFDRLFAFGIDPVGGGLPRINRRIGLLSIKCIITTPKSAKPSMPAFLPR